MSNTQYPHHFRMNEEENRLLNTWKRKRKITTILAMFHAFLVGLEYTSIAISALFYLNHILKTKHAGVFYGLTVGSMYVSSIIASVVLGSYMDRMRNARTIILGTVFLAVLGNLLYSLPFSPWLLVVGRFLCGFSDATFAVMTGEFTRCYHKTELNNVISKYGTVYTCSFAIGPCTPILLQWVHYHHWPIILEPSNSIGIFLMFIQILFAIFAYFGFANLVDEPGYELFLKSISHDEPSDLDNTNGKLNTKEFPESCNNRDETSYKRIQKSSKVSQSSLGIRERTVGIKKSADYDATCSKGSHLEENQTESRKSRRQKQKNVSLTIFEMFTKFDIVLVTFSSALTNFLHAMIDLQVNMVCLYTLHWTLTKISVITIIALSLHGIACIISYKRFLKNLENVYFFNLICFTVLWMDLFALLFLHNQYIDNFVLNVVLVVTLLMTNMYAGCSATLSGRLLLFQLVPSDSSSSCEGARMAISRCFVGAGFFVSALLFDEMFYFFIAFASLIILIYICFLVRRKQFY